MRIENPQSFRENVCKVIERFFVENKNTCIEPSNTTDIDKIAINNPVVDKIAINIEKGVYNFAIKEATFRKIVKKWENSFFVQLYLDRLRVIYINLKNPELRQQIETGELTANALAYMTHQEMNPEKWKVMIDRKIKRDESKFATRVEASTDMFTCKKCKSKRCTYYELQTRSADEPATIFITCLDCGKNYKN
jgi:transcription elongation factor S-II